ncbi:MAG: exosortase system-associated protein, TIGR04073 family [Candidatus Omnitrophica bacterium]|nr:exosortase system-associated protein, TIGR04073 family [Candidatus Omnitrophota bacterium]
MNTDMATKKIKISIFLLWGVVSALSMAYAKYEYKIDEPMYPYGQYESDTSAKLVRGITNAFYAWIELLQTPIRMSEGPRNHVVTGVLLGVPYGIFRFAGRTIVGVYEIVTCFVPQPPIFSPIQGDVL